MQVVVQSCTHVTMVAKVFAMAPTMNVSPGVNLPSTGRPALTLTATFNLSKLP